MRASLARASAAGSSSRCAIAGAAADGLRRGLLAATLCAASLLGLPAGAGADATATDATTEAATETAVDAGLLTPTDLMSVDGSALALSILTPETAEALGIALAAVPLDLEAVRTGSLSVPRLYVTRLPPDLRQVRVTDDRKTAFIGSLLPLVLMANEEILGQRAELQRLLAKEIGGEAWSLEEQAWLAALAEFYEVEPGDHAELLSRVDALPVSLTLAQAIEESGWGTSRYARDGNALFGQRTWHSNVPGLTARKDGQTLDHRARAFADLMQSVRAYMHNLNTHNAYRKLRDERARLRDEGAAVEGAHLAGFLGSYAENDTYVDNLRRLMRHNELAAYETAVLAAVPAASAPAETVSEADAAAEEAAVKTLAETLAEAEQSAAAGVSDVAPAVDEPAAPELPATLPNR